MNNARAVTLRSAGCCLRSLGKPKPKPKPKQSRAFGCATALFLLRQQPSASVLGLSFQHLQVSTPISSRDRTLSKHFSSSSCAKFRPAAVLHALGPLKPQVESERGLAFGEQPLEQQELQDIFGPSLLDVELGNRFLRVIHGRRIDGTLDLPLPADLQELIKRTPHTFERGLSWLRDNYYVDEDEAIVARIEREESGYDERTPSQLRQRAQDLKLYGPQSGKYDAERKQRRETGEPEYYGPQSGKYQAKLSDKGDVFGESQIEKIRERNEAEAKLEEERLEQQIEEIQSRRLAKAEEQRSQALAARPEQGVEISQDETRPPNQFEKWILRAKNKATSELTLESPEIEGKTVSGRLLPSAAFVALFGLGCWLFSQYWQPPKRDDRLWPSLSMSFATIAGIAAINVGIYICWRFPPLWGILNRYFLVVPATPRPLSLFGNVFSHVQTKHLLFNMLPLLVFGPSLHEEMGRGNFLALYLASGVIGSFASLTHHAVRGILYTSSLGASGSVWAITAAFFTVHSNNDFTVFFIPDEWKETAYLKGWMLFSCLIAIDILSGIRGKPVTVDYVAHASGALTGWILASWFKWTKAQSQGNREFVPKSKVPWWQMPLREGKSRDQEAS